MIKMISAQRSSNNGKTYVPKKTSYHGNIFNKGKRILTRLKLSSRPREKKFELKVPMKWKIFCAYLKGLSKYRRMAFSFLKNLFSF